LVLAAHEEDEEEEAEGEEEEKGNSPEASSWHMPNP